MLISLLVLKRRRDVITTGAQNEGNTVAGKGNFESQLIAAAGEEAVKTAKNLLKTGALAGAWRDAEGKLRGVFFAQIPGGRTEVAVTTGEHMTAECSECGDGVCAHAVALVMYSGRFPTHEKQEERPAYYGGLRTQTLPRLIERGRRSGAELSIQAQSTAPHVPSKWESMTLRVRLCEAGRECAGNLNNLRKLYFDKALNVVVRYEDFSLQEQQIIRFLALYGQPDGAGIALDSELTAELFHSLVGFPRFFRDGKALAIRAERAEPVLLANGARLHPGILIGGAPLAVSAAKVVAGRSGCWVGCDRDYFFVPGTCEIGFLRSFFRSSPLETPKPPPDFQLSVVNIRSAEPPVMSGQVLCDGALDGAEEKLRFVWSFVYPGRGAYTPGTGVIECSGGTVWRRDIAMERRFENALALFGFTMSGGGAAELCGCEKIALFFGAPWRELRRVFSVAVGGGLCEVVNGVPELSVSCKFSGRTDDGCLLSCRLASGGVEVPWETAVSVAQAGRRAFFSTGALSALPAATGRWLRGVSKVLHRNPDEESGFHLAFRDVSFFNTLSGAVPGALVPELFRDRAALPVSPPRCKFRGELRPYQKEGVEFMRFLGDRGFGALLADEMGLGKTVQLLALLASRYGSNDDPALVVCPASLVTNWEREIGRFIPEMRVGSLAGPGRREIVKLLDENDVVVLSYAAARMHNDKLRKRRFSFLVLDEAQHIKNPGSGNAKSCKNLSARRRIVLSGTPLENSPEDLWSIMDFLQPGMLGTLAEFRRTYCGTAAADPELKQELAARTAPFIKRRTKACVAPDLPSRSELTLYCELAPGQRELYERTLAEGRNLLRGSSAEKNGAAIFEVLLRLRQICCHPELLPDGIGSGVSSAKTELLTELLHENLDSSHKLLLFSQFTSLLHILKGQLDNSGIPYEYLDGSTRDRQKHVDNFNKNRDIPLFLLSLKAGGTGLNLTGADTVIIYDPWWNPAVEAQAADRTHRIGQTRPVTILKLVVKDSIEEKILLLQEQKRRLFDAVIADPAAGGLTLEELRLLLG